MDDANSTTNDETASSDPVPYPESQKLDAIDGVRFLLAEFEVISRYPRENIELADKRADVLFAFASAYAGGLIILFQSSVDRAAFATVLLGGSLMLLLFGALTFQQILQLGIDMSEYIRSLNRIRAYFAANAPSVRSYIMMPVSHEYPPYNWGSGTHKIVIAINSISAGTLLASAIYLILLVLLQPLISPTNIQISAFFAFAAGSIISYLAFSKYTTDYFHRYEERARSIRHNEESLFASHQRIWS